MKIQFTLDDKLDVSNVRTYEYLPSLSNLGVRGLYSYHHDHDDMTTFWINTDILVYNGILSSSIEKATNIIKSRNRDKALSILIE